MQANFVLRLLTALALILVFFLLIAVGLWVTQTAFTVWGQLQDAPTWFFYAYAGGFLLFGVAGVWLVWLILRPPRRGRALPAESVAPPTEEEIEQRLVRAQQRGLPVAAAHRELAQLRKRKQAGKIYVSLFGEISSGKSSLIRALLPGADVAVDVRGGTTRDIRQYRWCSPAGDELRLLDMPGTNEAAGELDTLIRDEALRSHLVIYVCDGDLTRSQFQELTQLLQLGKPCILALNKMDRYSAGELEAVKRRIRERLASLGEADIVAISAGGSEEVVRVLPDGSEEVVVRERAARTEQLKQRIQYHLDESPLVMEQLRDSAVFLLAARHLDQAEAAHRETKSSELVARYSRRAVIGAMAAVTPGSDLLIQGFLAINMIKELGSLYEVPVRKVDIDLLLELIQKQVGRTTPLVLAIAGNACKAFPGAGTLTGGLMHAVAYGMIFDTLGRSVAASLASRGALRPAQTAQAFKENLGEDLETSARRVVKLALAQKPQRDS